MNPFVFVVGCPRSGTTLLQRLLDAHPKLAVINETLWITRELQRHRGASEPVRVDAELVERLFDDSRFQRLELPRDEVDALVGVTGGVSFAEFVSNVFDLYGRHRDKQLVGDKSPGYVRNMSRLHSLWPHAKFIHLVRDGRDVWLSVAGWPKADRVVGRFATWVDDPIATTALWWERNVRLGREAGADLGPDRYLEVHYEDLVSDPERECGRMCAFLGLAFDDAMLRFYEGRTRHEPGLSSKRAWLPPTAGLRDWTTDMSRADVECFEAAAGELLTETGYTRLVPDLGADALESAARVRSALIDGARARGRRVPGRWQE